MENNSTNEAQPAKGTEKMALPWQDISTLNDSKYTGRVAIWHSKFDQPYMAQSVKDAKERVTFDDIAFDGLKYTHWLPLTPPEVPPVEPARVSLQEFVKDPACKWVNTSDGCPIKGWYQIQKEGESVMGLPFKLWDIAKKDHPIYATDPTAWLASQAEQETKEAQANEIP